MKNEKRYLLDYSHVYENPNGVGNPLIYEVNNVFPNAEPGELFYGLTTIYPGDVNGEYYMTKGHAHQQDTAELYYGVEGTGLILQEKDGDCIITGISPGAMVYCKSGYAHRLVNNSNDVLKVVCAARADSGHNYNIKFSQRVKKGQQLVIV